MRRRGETGMGHCIAAPSPCRRRRAPGRDRVPGMPVAPWCAPTSHWDCRYGDTPGLGPAALGAPAPDSQPQSDQPPVRRLPGVVHVTRNPDNAQKPAGHAPTRAPRSAFSVSGLVAAATLPDGAARTVAPPAPNRSHPAAPMAAVKLEEFTRHGSVSCRARCPVGR